MALTYTTIAAIQNRLSTRLQLSGVGQPYGKTVVSADLLEQLGTQVEAKVNATLRSVYKYPLDAIAATNTESRPILAAIVEKGVICELADVHFFHTEEGSSYGHEMCQAFADELEALKKRLFRLPGEEWLEVVELTTPNYAKAGKRTETAIEKIKW